MNKHHTLFLNKVFNEAQYQRFQMSNMNDTHINLWQIREQILTDGSIVYDIIGSSVEAKVTFNCVDKQSADRLLILLTVQCSGATAEVR